MRFASLIAFGFYGENGVNGRFGVLGGEYKIEQFGDIIFLLGAICPFFWRYKSAPPNAPKKPMNKGRIAMGDFPLPKTSWEIKRISSDLFPRAFSEVRTIIPTLAM